MTDILFTSDTHFSHARMATEIRGFGSVEEHDETIIENWNSVVKRDDVVWHLGDVGMGRLDKFVSQLRRLNGTIHLVTGNHDECWPGLRDSFRVQRQWMGIFQSIQAYARRRVGSTTVLMSHFPYDGDHTDTDRCTQYRLRNEGAWLLHGHTHFKDQQLHGHQLHVGLDAWGLKPVPLSVVQHLIGTASDKKKVEIPEDGYISP